MSKATIPWCVERLERDGTYTVIGVFPSRWKAYEAVRKLPLDRETSYRLTRVEFH